MDLGFNLAQSNQDLKDPTSRQNFGDTSGLLCKNDLIPCRIEEVPIVRCHNLCDFVQKLHDVREDHNKLILKLSWKIGLL